MWLSDSEANSLAEILGHNRFGKAFQGFVLLMLYCVHLVSSLRAGRVYVESYTALAQQALHEARPRYKMRPKFHQFHCELVLRLLTSRLNPRWGSCWTEEDYVGQITKIVKGAVHSDTISRRVLQRWQREVLQIAIQLKVSRSFGFKTDVYDRRNTV